MPIRDSFRLFFVVVGISICCVASASITVTNDPTGTGRPAFGGDDIVDWTGLGPNFTPIGNPFNYSSNGGLDVTVSQSNNSVFERRDLFTGWSGNFTDGGNLLWTRGSNGPMTITFASAVQGIGFQINPNYFDTQTDVSLYGSGGILLGTFNLNTNNRATPSASFVGFKSDAADILAVEISQPRLEDFTINQLSLITGGVVPEPATVFVWSGLGFAVAGSVYAKKRKAARQNA